MKTARADAAGPLPPQQPGKRKAGSARFAAYYKVQWFDDANLAWVDIQRSFATEEAARAAFPAGKRCRLMEVTPTGRRPLALP